MNMKIPESVRIAGVEHPVDFVEGLNDGSRILQGQIEYVRHKIHINPTSETDYQEKCMTLLHEILHGIRWAADVEIQDEEKVVDMFARGLYQVLQDNGGRLFDLKEESK